MDGEKNYGIAWHTKEILEPIAKQYGVKFVVLAEKGSSSEPELYQNNHILVLRVFDPKHHSLFPIILKWLFIFNKIHYVQVHSEFCANGGIKNQLLLLPFLLLIKSFNKHITYFAHNVVQSISDIAPHLNLKPHSKTVKLINFGLPYYYAFLGLLINQFVVMDQVILNRLRRFVPHKKIILIPFWVKNNNKVISQIKAKKELHIHKTDFVLLYFGFITYYKGADWLIQTFKKLQKTHPFRNIKLILAGGVAHSLKDHAYYQHFLEDIYKRTRSEKNITITGFVPEDKIQTYFSASDLVVFPYRGLIGASATLTHTLSYHKPFILSNYMKDLLINKEVSEILNRNKTKLHEILFEYNTKSFSNIIIKCKKNNFRKKLKRISIDLAHKRSFSHIIINCYHELYCHDHHQKAIHKA